ncbi:MAG: hypothetical protein K5880_06940 [Hydrogenophaga sp.]|uniref:hypothetical protein n=1 Tax=Hydrogenophaga sp. TaxID=1904254 RepID=UPI002635EE25|nr:hypothetical protein [Hydrogenophaga sp.]MCV0438349.1 hypothetical protein [Hydrogenophaga sp.]
MEQFKCLREVTEMDLAHRQLGEITGYVPSLPKMHAALAAIKLHEGVPVPVIGQFNVARNMALYHYFHYAMAPEVQMKTYSVIELALRLRFNASNGKTLAPLLQMALAASLLKDAGFRHLESPDPENSYSKRLPEILPKLRNFSAHGSTALTPDCLGHIEKCADLINQLFDRPA